MSDHNENCAIYHNSIDECDCERGQIRALKERVRVLEQMNTNQCDSIGILNGTINALREEGSRFTARIRELEEAMPKPETLRSVAFHLRDAGRYYSELGLPCLEDMADRIEKATKK